MTKIDQPFLKMHGAGNDFVILDLRQSNARVDATFARVLADRQKGVGCDQVISLEPSRRADVFMRIHNPDGSEAQACGNGSRCVASLLFRESGQDKILIESCAGLLKGEIGPDGLVQVDMGPAYLNWWEIPLAFEADTLSLDLTYQPRQGPKLTAPCMVSMGNPHAVFFVEDLDGIDIPTVGPILENHDVFPERANIGFVQILGQDRLRLRVWERGAGLTLACGSGACAALVASHRRGKCARRAYLTVDGGELIIEWRETDGHVLMSGGVATAFSGILDESLTALVQWSPA